MGRINTLRVTERKERKGLGFDNIVEPRCLSPEQPPERYFYVNWLNIPPASSTVVFSGIFGGTATDTPFIFLKGFLPSH